jgi:hypothetical protein
MDELISGPYLGFACSRSVVDFSDRWRMRWPYDLLIYVACRFATCVRVCLVWSGPVRSLTAGVV